MVSVCLIALSLAVDAAAAAVCCGLSSPGFRRRDGVRLGLWFGGFQFGMTLLGGMAGGELNEHCRLIGGMVAFGLLTYLGGQMLLDALAPVAGEPPVYALTTPAVAALALATSLDALAVGVSVAFLEVGLWKSAAVIGVVAFALSLLGSLLGRKIGQGVQRWASAGGGLALAAIGAKILWGVLAGQ